MSYRKRGIRWESYTEPGRVRRMAENAMFGVGWRGVYESGTPESVAVTRIMRLIWRVEAQARGKANKA